MLEAQPIIDPHHHLWDLGRNTYPWLQDRSLAPRLEGDIRPIAKDYLLEDYASDTRNQSVVKSVHVECGWDPSNPVGETEWLQRLADKHGYPHGIVGRATLDAPNVEQVLEGHARHKNTR
jgi:predicted TIM-barrel fold metal-dependent hydrolase